MSILTPLAPRFSLEIERMIFGSTISAHPEMRLTLRLLCSRVNEWILTLPHEALHLPCNASDGNSLLAPRLPPELEYIIFTLVASKQPEMHSTLNLVCRRVKEWIEPFDLECLFLATGYSTRHPMLSRRRLWEGHFTSRDVTAVLRNRPRVANGVRGVMLGWNFYEHPSHLFPYLSSLETAVRFPDFSLSNILSLPIRRLAFDNHAIEMFGLFTMDWTRRRGSLSSTLTHLELPSAGCIGVYLEDLPALSHLCIDLWQHRALETFVKILFPRRQFLQRLVARDSFHLLVLRVLPYLLGFSDPMYSPSIYKRQLRRCRIPVEKVVGLETEVDATLGMCNYLMGEQDMWCQAEDRFKVIQQSIAQAIQR
ncbi:hypothetical protein B0H16DRAFT_1681818 [Mycena metata]|uniref:Uncharacterized protein n=1 Tax=Mycena metata TaxID=1033252 RepID=A0AAD7KGT7_9AGAR|nr:hypothetical protein B0H16DRAFT_1681818 [Mycena metata]